MNNEQVLVLRHLAAHLASLPEDYDKFGMNSFAKDEDGNDKEPREAAEHPCGTVACAIGHLALLGYPQIELHCDIGLRWEGWFHYSARLTGLDIYGDSSIAWVWCFAGRWATFDDTPLGAAQRITYFLDGGSLDSFRANLAGFAPRDGDRFIPFYNHITREHIAAQINEGSPLAVSDDVRT